MKRNKLFGYVMTGALALGVIGGAAFPAFAATSSSTNSVAENVKASLDDETKQKVQEIMEQLKSKYVPIFKKGERGG